jgi:hypothetical protein
VLLAESGWKRFACELPQYSAYTWWWSLEGQFLKKNPNPLGSGKKDIGNHLLLKNIEEIRFGTTWNSCPQNYHGENIPKYHPNNPIYGVLAPSLSLQFLPPSLSLATRCFPTHPWGVPPPLLSFIGLWGKRRHFTCFRQKWQFAKTHV